MAGMLQKRDIKLLDAFATEQSTPRQRCCHFRDRMLSSRPVNADRQRRSAYSGTSPGDFQNDSNGAQDSSELGEMPRSPEAVALESDLLENKRRGPLNRIKNFFVGDKFDRKRLAALGLGAVASYGFVSNATYGTGMAVSWVAFVQKTGKSPLMPGEWKAFLAFFAGFWTLQHFLRPLRFTLAIAMAPAFDRVIVFLQKLTGWNKRNAFGLYLVLFGSITSLLVFGSIFVFGGPQAFSRG